jgi:S1-C subfamily serine protease
VLVASMAKDGPAARAGLQEGDVIVQFAGVAVSGIDDLHRQLTDERIGKAVSVTVLRRGRRQVLTLKPDELQRN